MSFLDKLGGILGGGTAGKIADIFANRITNKAEAEMARIDLEKVIGDREHELRLAEVERDREAERQFNERTVALEGTANDLKALPFVGSVVIFLRGAFRPLFAYFTAYLDYRYYIDVGWTERQESLLLAINLLVLVFFFGERAMKNVMPLIAEVFAAKAGK